MDQRRQELLHFVAVWAPYGGPPEDELFVRFGITPEELRQRLGQLDCVGHAADNAPAPAGD
jgi:hypothetical protein